MANLATENDLEARLGRELTGTEQTRAAAYLADISAAIRGYTRQDFTAVSSDTARLRPVGTRLVLPQRPVTAVNSVTAIGWAGIPDLPLPAGFWGFDGIDAIELAPFNSDVWLSLPTVELGEDLPDTYEVDYDHGEATVPDDVIGIACGAVLRVLLSPSLQEGLNTERIGQYSYGFQQGGGGTPGATVRLTEQDKLALREAGYGPRQAGTVQVRL